MGTSVSYRGSLQKKKAHLARTRSTVRAVRHGHTVRRGETAKAVALHDTLETLADPNGRVSKERCARKEART